MEVCPLHSWLPFLRSPSCTCLPFRLSSPLTGTSTCIWQTYLGRQNFRKDGISLEHRSCRLSSNSPFLSGESKHYQFFCSTARYWQWLRCSSPRWSHGPMGQGGHG